MILLARAILTEEPGASFVCEVKSSKALYDEIEHGLTLNVRGEPKRGIDGYFDIAGEWTLRRESEAGR